MLRERRRNANERWSDGVLYSTVQYCTVLYSTVPDTTIFPTMRSHLVILHQRVVIRHPMAGGSELLPYGSYPVTYTAGGSELLPYDSRAL